MADFEPFEARIASINEEWDKSEKVIKQAEQVCGNVLIPPLMELRYGGRRIVEALHGIYSDADEDSINNLLQDALFDCHRARHDAIDAATSEIARYLVIAEDKIKPSVLLTSFVRYMELKNAVTDVNRKIVSSRMDRNNREATYSTLADIDFDRLLTLYEDFVGSEPVMVKIAAKERLNRFICHVVAILGVILTITFGALSFFG